MTDARKLTRIPTLKTPADFKAHLQTLGLDLPCDDTLATGSDSPLLRPVENVTINGKRIGNRIAIHPMEGWDGTTTGGVTDDMLRRWRRFGESGAKLIFGGEAMAVRPDGRANPNQLILNRQNLDGIRKLRIELVAAHRAKYGTADDLVIGFQLTHSGRFCRPNDKKKLEPRIAYRHPILDKKFGLAGTATANLRVGESGAGTANLPVGALSDTSHPAILTDAELQILVQDYVNAAALAAEAGADFVDIKHCHGYLLHEFLSAYTRPGPYGGAFENRTRLLREIVAGIRASGNQIELAVRLSAFDFVPFRPDPALSTPGKPGPGIPEDFTHCLPYKYAFGVNQNNPTEIDLTEPVRFIGECAHLGIKLINLSAGSPYYNPHIQRPAAYPPSDGYQPPNDPLIDVARQIHAVRQIRAVAPPQIAIIGTAYSYLQEYLPHVAQALLREKWTDLIGLGRMTLSYPELLTDAANNRPLTTKQICRTFSDCTTAPRNGLPSGCYPLDKHYSAKPEATVLKEMKKAQ
jgi:2,4-dienoyl-CoA reductase-like NADH-dependent reductase (Old Yellow Enzyme family)